MSPPPPTLLPKVVSNDRKKDLYRREGKGRPCFLGNRISAFSSNRPGAKKLTRQGIEEILPPRSSDYLYVLFCINPSHANLEEKLVLVWQHAHQRIQIVFHQKVRLLDEREKHLLEAPPLLPATRTPLNNAGPTAPDKIVNNC